MNLRYTCKLSLAALLLSSSCDDMLEVEPQQSLPINTVFSTPEDLDAGVLGAYSAFQDVDLGGANLTIFPDIYADNVEFVGSFPSVQQIANQEVPANNAEIQGLYGDGYTVINQANLVLANLPEVEFAEDQAEVADRIRGEALFIRALMHFELVRWLGQPYGINSDASQSGVVIRTEPVTSPEDISAEPRNTVNEVYAQIVEDLQAAVELLPAENENGRADRYTATGLLARVRFQQQEYALAAELAQEVIEGPFSLTADASGFFRNDFSTESVWELVHTAQDQQNNINITEFTNRQARDGDVRVSDDLRANGYYSIVTPAMEARLAAAGLEYYDERVTQLLEAPDGSPATLDDPSTLVHPYKYEDASNTADNSMPMRLAEFMLLRAEALLRASGNAAIPEALELLNQVRLRSLNVITSEGVAQEAAPFVAYTAADINNSAEALIEAIITERRVELAFEGNRYHDLARLRRPTRPGGVAPGDDEFIFPISQNAINANGQLVQNPGY